MDELDADESGAFLTFAPALPSYSGSSWAGHDTGGESMPHLTLMSDAYEDTFSTAMFAVAVPAHLGAVPLHDRASRIFQCASSTSTVETSAGSSSDTSTPHTDTPLQRLSRLIRMR